MSGPSACHARTPAGMSASLLLGTLYSGRQGLGGYRKGVYFSDKCVPFVVRPENPVKAIRFFSGNGGRCEALLVQSVDRLRPRRNHSYAKRKDAETSGRLPKL